MNRANPPPPPTICVIPEYDKMTNSNFSSKYEISSPILKGLSNFCPPRLFGFEILNRPSVVSTAAARVQRYNAHAGGGGGDAARTCSFGANKHVARQSGHRGVRGAISPYDFSRGAVYARWKCKFEPVGRTRAAVADRERERERAAVVGRAARRRLIERATAFVVLA